MDTGPVPLLPDAPCAVRLRVLCTPLPSRTPGDHRNLQLGIQHGKEEIRPGEEAPEGTLRFECEVRVQRKPATGRPNFLGPWVHGPPDARFLYLVWEAQEDGVWRRLGRMKIHLASITWEQIEATGDGVLEVAVSGVGPNGPPACASVPLLGAGWRVRRG